MQGQCIQNKFTAINPTSLSAEYEIYKSIHIKHHNPYIKTP
uniref:Uncharacterized protein n=1 Tax=Rhizophora mucronata TaxID=61149 RepID=A0A2P2NL11_RHIMU